LETVKNGSDERKKQESDTKQNKKKTGAVTLTKAMKEKSRNWLLVSWLGQH